ncbi:hypothetical protein [uncultured Kordia sp.]|uniref:hypothetical protein n=1 Tax=uncultured Kordia sp. TaxID=507699 RepID=UPI0026245DA5|nr:hypothetical protein [uncultured Kordia sp.]
MRTKLNCIIVVLTMCLSAYAQQTYTLKLIDCDLEDNLLSSRQSVDILSEHEIIEKFPDEIIFKTATNQIKVRYQNLYDQQLDTVFILKDKNTTTFRLCLDRFKDDLEETCIEHAIKKKARWKLNLETVGCSGRHTSKIVIFPKKDSFVAKYVFSKYVSQKKKYERVVKYRVLNSAHLNDIIRFEKKLRLHGAAVKATYGDTIGGIYLYTYKIQSGNIKKEIKSSLSLQTIDKRYLLKKLGFES